jgi:transcriptional regulator with GAF, ATPase, and Fis domain
MVWDAVTKYRLLLDLNNAVLREITRSGLFSALAAEIRKIFRFDRFSINIYDSETKSLSYFSTAKGISPAEISVGERPVSKAAIAHAVIRSRRPLIIPNLETHMCWESVRAMKASGLSTTMAYPLIVRDQVLGSMHFSFVSKPENLERLEDFLPDLSKQVAIAVDNMLVNEQLWKMNEHLRREKDFLLSQDGDTGAGDFFYESQAMKDIMRQARLIAGSDASVLITGETGTGKDHIARCIHNESSRRDALLVKVDCPALTPTLFESELFGHAKGAFTGASFKHVGRFEMADGGTVFLDEIGELDRSLQAKLLNVLQDQVFHPVGSSRPVSVDFRLISATNKEMERCIGEGSFRKDLYFRLATFTIHIPPLRARTEDIPVLVERLTSIQARKTHRPLPAYADSCMEAMCRYSWPGNVRELKNLLKRLVIMRPGAVISAGEFESLVHADGHAAPAGCITLEDMEKQHILRALTMSGGVVGGPRGAASLLGVPRQTLQYKMRKHGLTNSRMSNKEYRISK